MRINDTFIRIGKIIGAHGLHGRLKIIAITDIEERFAVGNWIYLKEGDDYRKYQVVDFVLQRDRRCILNLKEISDRDEALSFKGIDIFIQRDEAERTRHLLEEEAYYYYDIIGCSVFREGELFGEVIDILEAGAGEILIIRDAAGNVHRIPFVQSMVDTSEIALRRIDIYPIEGLIE